MKYCCNKLTPINVQKQKKNVFFSLCGMVAGDLTLRIQERI